MSNFWGALHSPMYEVIRPLTLKAKVYTERSYTICKNGVGKVAKTGQHGDKQHAPKQPADHGNKSRNTPLFYAFLPLDI